MPHSPPRDSPTAQSAGSPQPLTAAFPAFPPASPFLPPPAADVAREGGAPGFDAPSFLGWVPAAAVAAEAAAAAAAQGG
eukprot:gene32000-29193_t